MDNIFVCLTLLKWAFSSENSLVTPKGEGVGGSRSMTITFLSRVKLDVKAQIRKTLKLFVILNPK